MLLTGSRFLFLRLVKPCLVTFARTMTQVFLLKTFCGLWSACEANSLVEPLGFELDCRLLALVTIFKADSLLPTMSLTWFKNTCVPAIRLPVPAPYQLAQQSWFAFSLLYPRNYMDKRLCVPTQCA